MSPNVPEFPSKATRALEPQDLLAGDVLLSLGQPPRAALIVAVDGGRYSHAALWSGGGVIESTLNEGVIEGPASGPRDVYRYRDPKTGLTLTDKARSRIADYAKSHVGQRYAVSELLLLGFLLVRNNAIARRHQSLIGAMIEAFGGRKAQALQQFLQELYERRAPRICSELVALAYFAAEYDGLGASKYALRITPREDCLARSSISRIATESECDSELAELTDSVATMLDLDSFRAEARGALYGHLAFFDTDPPSPVDIVTPADLEFSPSLQYLGRLN